MTTPQTLNKLRKERGWSPQDLADAIYDATRIRINARTVSRFLEEIGQPSEATRDAIALFMAKRKALGDAQGAPR